MSTIEKHKEIEQINATFQKINEKNVSKLRPRELRLDLVKCEEASFEIDPSPKVKVSPNTPVVSGDTHQMPKVDGLSNFGTMRLSGVSAISRNTSNMPTPTDPQVPVFSPPSIETNSHSREFFEKIAAELNTGIRESIINIVKEQGPLPMSKKARATTIQNKVNDMLYERGESMKDTYVKKNISLMKLIDKNLVNDDCLSDIRKKQEMQKYRYLMSLERIKESGVAVDIKNIQKEESPMIRGSIRAFDQVLRQSSLRSASNANKANKLPNNSTPIPKLLTKESSESKIPISFDRPPSKLPSTESVGMTPKTIANFRLSLEPQNPTSLKINIASDEYDIHVSAGSTPINLSVYTPKSCRSKTKIKTFLPMNTLRHKKSFLAANGSKSRLSSMSKLTDGSKGGAGGKNSDKSLGGESGSGKRSGEKGGDRKRTRRVSRNSSTGPVSGIEDSKTEVIRV
jgi:hypothetical protein